MPSHNLPFRSGAPPTPKYKANVGHSIVKDPKVDLRNYTVKVKANISKKGGKLRRKTKKCHKKSKKRVRKCKKCRGTQKRR